MKRGFTITVDNSIALSHNINIDCPQFFCFARTICEAIGKMMASDFAHKYRKITDVDIF